MYYRFVLFPCILCHLWRQGEKIPCFLPMGLCAMGHLIFDAITVVTVNNREHVPEAVNHVAHVLLYFFGVAFLMQFFRYVFHLTIPLKKRRRPSVLTYIPMILFLVLAFTLPIEYRSGKGTDYSSGALVFAGYGICILYCIGSIISLLRRWELIDVRVRCSVVPMSLILLVIIVAQAFVPELLMTGAGLMFVSIGVFFTLDNPIDKLKEQAYWDTNTGVKNKNCYLVEIRMLKNRFQGSHTRLGFIVADLNNLKMANDLYGHNTGDKLIKTAAIILRDNLKSAYDVYRTGGDEFMAIYVAPVESAVRADMDAVKSACRNVVGFPVPLYIALGYSEGNLNHTELAELVEKADKAMYRDKKTAKVKCR